MERLNTYRFPFASYPAIRLVLAFATGIITNFYLDLNPLWWFFSFGFSISSLAFLDFSQRRKLKIAYHDLAVLCYLTAVICFGGAWHALYNNQDKPVRTDIIEAYTWNDLQFSGKVYQIKPTNSGKYQIDLSIDSTTFPNQTAWEESYNLRAVLNPDDIPFPAHLKLGDRMIFKATVYPLNEPTNPHQFDYKGYLASQKIYLQAGLKSITNIVPGRSSFNWNYIRQQVLRAIEHNFSPETTPLAKALLIGNKNALARDTKIAFSRAGLSHIMAVSGLHVGFILAPFWVIIPFFWSFKNGKRLGLLILIILLLFYAGLTGFSASVIRASLTGGLLAYSRLFHRVSNAKNLTAVAALIILLINPSELFSIGFQLSFGAVYIILMIAPIVSRTLPDYIRFRWYGTPIMVIVISIIVQLGLFPLLAYYFGEFSLVGPLANAFVVPLLGIAVPFGLLLLLFAGIWPAAAQTLNIPVDYFLQILHRFVTTTAGWEWSWIPVQIDTALMFILWIVAIFGIAAIPLPKIRWKFLILFLLIATVEQGYRITHKIRSPNLELTIFDVGQGDATLLSTPSGKHYLIDTGRWQPGYNSAKYVILPYLKGEGIRKLSGIFLSHPHADHIGGMKELLNTIPIDTIYNSGSRYESTLFHDYQQIAEKQHTPIKSLHGGQYLKLDSSTELFIYGPTPTTESASNVNNRSLILEVIYGDTEFLFMGDAERSQEARLIREYPDLINTDFLKVGHHGSKTSSTTQLLNATSPDIGVVSLGLHNRFQHPHSIAVKRLRRDSVRLHFTSLQGAIQLYSNGKTIRFKQ